MVYSSPHTRDHSVSTPATVPKLDPDVFEISSDESEHGGLEKREKSVSKKRILAHTKEVIEISDSEDELPNRLVKKMKMEPEETALNASIAMMRTGTEPKLSESSTLVTNTEDASSHESKVSDAEKRTITDTNLELAVGKAEKDRDGKFILTKKVKVDEIEHLSEVPKRWPIPPKGLNVAYVVDLNNDKRWKELDKKKGLDRFLKQEVFNFKFLSD
jgi:hypothetical protein